MKEYTQPRPHKRFRVKGDGKHAGRNLELAAVPEGEVYCLHVFLEWAPATRTMWLRIGGQEPKWPGHLCDECAAIAGADKPTGGKN